MSSQEFLSDQPADPQTDGTTQEFVWIVVYKFPNDPASQVLAICDSELSAQEWIDAEFDRLNQEAIDSTPVFCSSLGLEKSRLKIKRRVLHRSAPVASVSCAKK